MLPPHFSHLCGKEEEGINRSGKKNPPQILQYGVSFKDLFFFFKQSFLILRSWIVRLRENMVGRKQWFSTLSIPWGPLKELPEKYKISALDDSDNANV